LHSNLCEVPMGSTYGAKEVTLPWHCGSPATARVRAQCPVLDLAKFGPSRERLRKESS